MPYAPEYWFRARTFQPLSLAHRAFRKRNWYPVQPKVCRSPMATCCGVGLLAAFLLAVPATAAPRKASS